IEPVGDATLPPAPMSRVMGAEPSRNSPTHRRKAAPVREPLAADDGPATDTTHTATELADPAPPQPAPPAGQPERRRRTMQSVHKLQPVAGSGSTTAPAVSGAAAKAPVASGGSSKALIAVIVVCTMLIIAVVVGVFWLKLGASGLVLIDVPA